MKAIITAPDPHCRVWARAVASLWGHVEDHDLDEPVRLSDEIPVRLGCNESVFRNTFSIVTDRGAGAVVTDKEYNFKTLRSGTHVAIRFYFSNGTYLESEISSPRVQRATKVKL